MMVLYLLISNIMATEFRGCVTSKLEHHRYEAGEG